MSDLFTDEEPKLILASKTKRFFAILIDYIIYSVAFYLMAKFFGEEYTTEDGGTSLSVNGFPAFVCIFFWFLIMPVMEGIVGQSVGKMVFGIKTLKQDGSKVSIGNATVRHLFDIIDFFPFFGIVGLLVASKNKLSQRVGDLVANTIVVEK